MEENTAYFILGQAIFLLIILLITVILIIKQRKLNKKYKKFMQGASGRDLEAIITEKITDIDILKQETTKIHKELDNINENLLTAVQKIGIVKYDAFMEMGGKLSFVLALLDKNNDGFILNSVHSSREGCYTYLKEIIKGESFLELSKEEKDALNQAIKYNDFMG
jgi:hypothetical protein